MLVAFPALKSSTTKVCCAVKTAEAPAGKLAIDIGEILPESAKGSVIDTLFKLTLPELNTVSSY